MSLVPHARVVRDITGVMYWTLAYSGLVFKNRRRLSEDNVQEVRSDQQHRIVEMLVSSILHSGSWMQRWFNTTPTTATAFTSYDMQDKNQKISSLALAAARLSTAAVQTLHLVSLILVAQQ